MLSRSPAFDLGTPHTEKGRVKAQLRAHTSNVFRVCGPRCEVIRSQRATHLSLSLSLSLSPSLSLCLRLRLRAYVLHVLLP